MRKSLIILGLLIVVVGVVFYFSTKKASTLIHQRGNLICSSCHVMHARRTTDDAPGVETRYNNGTGNPYLLTAASVSDACLTCHDGIGDAAAPDVLTVALQKPGGDFNDINTAGGLQTGHNVTDSTQIAANTKYKNGANHVAPTTEALTAASVYFNGTTKFTCASCHDPHNATSTVDVNDRLLRLTPAGMGVGAPAGYVAGNALFEIDENKTAAELVANAESNTFHNGYQDVPTFCQDCHGNIHNDEAGQSQNSWFRHPTGTTKNLADISYAAITYAVRYGGAGLTYAAGYPLQESTNVEDETTMATTDKVMCLSCHRAHATPNSTMVRWLKTAQIPAATDGNGTACNKCHNK